MTRIKFIMFGQLQQMVLQKPWQKLTNLLLCKAPSQNFPAERRQKHSTKSFPNRPKINQYLTNKHKFDSCS